MSFALASPRMRFGSVRTTGLLLGFWNVRVSEWQGEVVYSRTNTAFWSSTLRSQALPGTNGLRSLLRAYALTQMYWRNSSTWLEHLPYKRAILVQIRIPPPNQNGLEHQPQGVLA